MNKIIYTDCDGVLLDWETGFHNWMEAKGYTAEDKTLYKMGLAYGISNNKAHNLIREFNESAAMLDLPVFRDARSGVARLVDAGYKFHVISSLSKDENAHKLRIMNLEAVFGKNVFVGYDFLATGADKDEILATLPAGAWWLEDKDENAVVGYKLGLNAILMAHAHNADVTDVPRCDTFNEITDRILYIDNNTEA